MSERRPKLPLRRLSLMLIERNKKRKGSKPQLKEKGRDSLSLNEKELGLKLNRNEPDLRQSTNERDTGVSWNGWRSRQSCKHKKLG